MTTVAEWRQRLLDGLSDEGVDVELTQRQLDYALRRAAQLFNKHQPHKTWWHIGTLSASRTHRFVLDANTYGMTAIDVQMKDADRWLSTPIVAGAFEFRYGVRGPGIFYEYLVADRRYEFFTGEAPDWKWIEDERTLYVTNPRRRIELNVLFVRNRTPDEIPWHLEFDYEEVALANAKLLLARILGSYGSIPGATGEIPTDAANLREEGMATIDRVRLRLERSAASYVTPRYIG